jgi:hypothetical protein
MYHHHTTGGGGGSEGSKGGRNSKINPIGILYLRVTYWMAVNKTDQTRKTIDDREYFSDKEQAESDDDVSFDNGDDTSLSDEYVAESFASCASDEVEGVWGHTKVTLQKLAAAATSIQSVTVRRAAT